MFFLIHKMYSKNVISFLKLACLLNLDWLLYHKMNYI